VLIGDFGLGDAAALRSPLFGHILSLFTLLPSDLIPCLLLTCGPRRGLSKAATISATSALLEHSLAE
jgi:hypothetical protein